MSQNRENETGLIGSILRDPYKFDLVREMITSDDFDWHPYGWCWKAFESLRNQGLHIDQVTLGDELNRVGKLNDFQLDENKVFTGRNALGKLRDSGSPAAVETYAANVLDYSAKRLLLEEFSTGAQWAKNGRRAADIISDMMQRFNKIRTFDGKSAKHTQKLSEAVSAAYDHTDAAARGEIQFVMTDFIDLDKMLGGISAPDLLIIAGRPGQGKTAFLVSVAMNVAKQKKRVAFFSLEMKNTQIAMRLLAQASGVSYDKQKTGKLAESDWAKYTNAVEHLSAFEDYPIYINDLPSIKPSQIRRELMRIGSADLVIVDYVGLADSDGKYDTRALEVSAIMKSFKAVCKEFDIPMLAAAQLSRAVEQRQNKKPILSDLKESGGIEENADIVMFIHRPDEESNNTEIIVAKHRNGQVGTIDLIYRPELTRFDNAASKMYKFNEPQS
jgi:replicative DNA helicase